MDKNANALYQFLIEHANGFTEEWAKRQRVISRSDYSADAPADVKKRVNEQNTNYVRLVAKSLIQTEEEMKGTIFAWTSKTSADRIKSKTNLSEVAWNSGVFRRLYWEYIQKFVKQSNLEITIDDIFAWETKINYTLDYILETFIMHYMDILLSRLSSQATLIKDLSAPVITLTDQVGLLPLIGEIDTTRAKNLMDTTLSQTVLSGISVLVIDISGVVMVDTMVALQIFKLVDALKLLGVKTVLTGIRPEVAQTAVQLGIDFTGVATAGNLKNIVKKIITTS